MTPSTPTDPLPPPALHPSPPAFRGCVLPWQVGACLAAADSQSGVKLCCSVLPDLPTPTTATITTSAPPPPSVPVLLPSLSRAHTCGAHIFSLISSADLGPSGCFCAHVLRVRFPLSSPPLIESLIALTLKGLQFSCHARSDELAAPSGGWVG